MKIGFIGGGNMANAIAGGILSAQLCKPGELYVSDVSLDALEKYEKLGVHTATSIDIVLDADILILAVKPFIIPMVLTQLKEQYSDKIKDKVFVSIAAGVPISEIKNHLGFDAKVVRVMPNTPALVGAGMSVLASEFSPVTQDEFDAVRSIFDAVGETEVLSESLLNAVTAVSGSSPAYVYMMIEAMADAAVQGGIARPIAYKLAAQSVLGSAKMVLDTKKHPGELKDMVCSPKGTTIDAVAALEEYGFRNAIIKAMERCTNKANNIK